MREIILKIIPKSGKHDTTRTPRPRNSPVQVERHVLPGLPLPPTDLKLNAMAKIQRSSAVQASKWGNSQEMKDFAWDPGKCSHPQTGRLNEYLFLEEQGFLEKSPAYVGIPNQRFILLSFAEDRLRKYFFCWELSHIPSLFGTCASMIFPDRSVKPSAEKWLEDCGFFEKGLLLLVLGRVSLPCK